MSDSKGRRANDAYYLSRGRCPRCGGKNPVAAGEKVCDLCREKNNERRRQTRAKRRALGLCTKCGGVRDEARYVMCSKCRGEIRKKRGKAKRAAGKKWYDRMREEGRCVSCGGWAEPGRARCKACQRKSNERIRKADPNLEKKYALRRSRIEKGLCIDCGRKAGEGKTRCPRCMEMRRDSTRKYKITRKIRGERLDGRTGETI